MRIIKSLLLLLILLLPLQGIAQGKPVAGFEVLSADTELAEGYYHLNAGFALRFSDETLKALDSGVPITIQVDIEILRHREYIWDETIHDITLLYEIRYHSLTKRHVITNLLTGNRSHYRSRHAAINALGSLRETSILDASLLLDDQSYSGRIRCGIDIEALPAPLRIPAYLSREWKLQSDWFTWSLREQ